LVEEVVAGTEAVWVVGGLVAVQEVAGWVASSTAVALV